MSVVMTAAVFPLKDVMVSGRAGRERALSTVPCPTAAAGI